MIDKEGKGSTAHECTFRGALFLGQARGVDGEGTVATVMAASDAGTAARGVSDGCTLFG